MEDWGIITLAIGTGVFGWAWGRFSSAMVYRSRIIIAEGKMHAANGAAGKLSRRIGAQRRKIREMRALLPKIDTKKKYEDYKARVQASTH
jgi:hypothetical protein